MRHYIKYFSKIKIYYYNHCRYSWSNLVIMFFKIGFVQPYYPIIHPILFTGT